MHDNSETFNQSLMEALQTVARDGINNAADGFSGMIGEKLVVSNPSVSVVPVFDIPKLSGGPETEAIGVYLRVEGDITGQIMLIIPYEKALEIVDLLMDEPTGTTTELGRLERSALAEVGNQTASFFLNTVANQIGGSVRPSPPSVMVDMVGAILDIIVAVCGGIGENVLLLQADFMNGDRSVDMKFWVIPDMDTLSVISKSE
jgi:chemotaxis protein CheC